MLVLLYLRGPVLGSQQARVSVCVTSGGTSVFVPQIPARLSRSRTYQHAGVCRDTAIQARVSVFVTSEDGPPLSGSTCAAKNVLV